MCSQHKGATKASLSVTDKRRVLTQPAFKVEPRAGNGDAKSLVGPLAEKRENRMMGEVPCKDLGTVNVRKQHAKVLQTPKRFYQCRSIERWPKG